MNAKNAQLWIDKGINLLMEYGPKIIIALLLWVIGNKIIKYCLKFTETIMDKRDYDTSLKKFLMSLVGWGLKIVLVLTILGTLGIETTSFAAILAAAGLAIGMALQGSLANFAGGVLIMTFKPFKIGDFIVAQGESGVVKHIDIFTTKINTVENKLVILPNGTLSNGNITNVSSEEKLRVDLTFGVGYESDIKTTKKVLLDVVKNNSKVLKDPAPVVVLAELGDSSINFKVRAWTKTADYWDVYFQSMEDTKEALDKAGIDIPYPHSVEIQKKG